MSAPSDSPDLDAGRDALARGGWEDAKAAFERVLGNKESPEALEGIGLAAWWLDRGDAVPLPVSHRGLGVIDLRD